MLVMLNALWILFQISVIHCINELPLELVKNLRSIIDAECKSNNSLYLKDLPIGTRTCPPDGDTFQCYPETIAGTIQRMPCLFVMFDPNVNYETRRCKDDGTWENPSTRTCNPLPTKKFLQARIDLFAERGIQLENETDLCYITDNGGCESQCKETNEGNVTCSCPSHQYLAKDEKSCIDNELPEYGGPTNSPDTITPCPYVNTGICDSRDDGNYAWAGHPNCFIQCTNGKPNCQCCYPKSLFYVEKCDQCLTNKLAECPSKDDDNKTSTTTTTTPVPLTTDVSTETVGTPTKTKFTGCTSESATKFCTGPSGVAGAHRILSHHTHYIVCIKGTGKKLLGFCMACPEGLVWIPVHKMITEQPAEPAFEYTGYCGYQ